METAGFDALLKTISESATVAVDPSMFKFVHEYIDPATPRAAGLWYLEKFVSKKRGQNLLDFGCGSSPHRKFIEKMGYTYLGVDLAKTTGYRGQLESRRDITFYDGDVLPFTDQMFDVVYANQVFEHVVDPFRSMAECSRVLRKGGAFIGAVSFLEPYHAYQTFSYTPYGFTQIAERSGFKLRHIYPDRDVLEILLRKLLIITRNKHSDNFADYPRLSTLFEKAYSKLSEKERISLSLQFCGSFSFHYEKVTAR